MNYRTNYKRKYVSAALGAKAMIRGTAILNKNMSMHILAILFINILALWIMPVVGHAAYSIDIKNYTSQTFDFLSGDHNVNSIKPGQTKAVEYEAAGPETTRVHSINIGNEFLANLTLYGPPKPSRAYKGTNNPYPMLSLKGTKGTSVSAQPDSRSFDLHSELIWRLVVAVTNAPSLWENEEVISISTPDEAGHYLEWAQKWSNTSSIPGCAASGINIEAARYDKAAGSLQGTHVVGRYVFRWWRQNSDMTPLDRRLIEGNDLGDGLYALEITELPENKTIYNKVFIFGDSLSDTQNVFNRTAGFSPRGGYYNGRWSNGIMWPDFLTLSTGVPVDNRAFGGAKLSKDEDMNSGGYKMCSAAHSSRLPVAPSITTQVDIAKSDVSDALADGGKIAVFFLFGGNDYGEAYKGRNASEDELIQHTDSLSIYYSNAIQSLYNSVAENLRENLVIYYIDLPDLAISPSFIDYKETTKKFSDLLNGSVTAKLDEASIPYTRIGLALADDMANAPGLYKLNDPSKESIFGSTRAEDGYSQNANYLGFNSQTDDAGAGIQGGKLYTSAALIFDSVLAYDQSKINKTFTADKLHPTSKFHSYLSNDLVYSLMETGGLHGGVDCNKYDSVLKDICITKGMRSEYSGTSSFFNLLQRGELSSQPRPDFLHFHGNSSFSGGVAVGPGNVTIQDAAGHTLCDTKNSRFLKSCILKHIDVAGDVTLRAIADENPYGFFLGFSGGKPETCDDENLLQCNFVYEDNPIVATFALTDPEVTFIQIEGGGEVQVTDLATYTSPCNTANSLIGCSEINFYDGQELKLSARPDNSPFEVIWEGCEIDPRFPLECTVTFDSQNLPTVKATFPEE